MMYNEDDFNYCLRKTSAEAKIVCAAEECAELIQCCTKVMRGRSNGEHFVEELSDVMLNLHLLIAELEISPSLIEAEGNKKLARFRSRLEAGEKP